MAVRRYGRLVVDNGGCTALSRGRGKRSWSADRTSSSSRDLPGGRTVGAGSELVARRRPADTDSSVDAVAASCRLHHGLGGTRARVDSLGVPGHHSGACRHPDRAPCSSPVAVVRRPRTTIGGTRALHRAGGRSYVAARIRSCASIPQRERRHASQHVDRRLGHSSSAARAAAAVQRQHLLSGAEHAGVFRGAARAVGDGGAAGLGRSVTRSDLQHPADRGLCVDRLGSMPRAGPLDRRLVGRHWPGASCSDSTRTR